MPQEPTFDLSNLHRCRIVSVASAFTRLWDLRDRNNAVLYSDADLWTVLDQAFERGYEECLIAVDGKMHLLLHTEIE